MIEPPAAPPPPPGVLIELGRDDAVVRGGRDGAIAGAPLGPASYADVVVDAVLVLEEGTDDDAYGLFLRQSDERRYLAVVLQASGSASVLLLDGEEPFRLAEGPLPPDVPFARGVGAANRLTVAMIGPCIVPIVNGVALTGVIVDRRFAAGGIGIIVVPVGPGPERVVGRRWAQVRSVFDTPA